ncbi:DHHC palmitoyltransferase-domain-containing protein [Phycomyces nitens]|nr:DHHC palmitoyltransferase-domain-containing protein [Phycomyces nitens]
MLESIPGKVFVVGVVLLIATIAYSSQLMVFGPALGGLTMTAVWFLAPLNALVAMVFYNYYLAVTTDPGKVPSDWVPAVVIKENKPLGITGPRVCKACNIYKPPRSHHCRYCKRCVLKMDHHCPWIDNCVGHGNYPHFMRFVIYVDLACSYVVGLLVWRVRIILDSIRHFQFNAEPSTPEIVFMVLNFVLAFVVLFCVGILSVYHLYCIAKNQSTIEGWERGKVEKLVKRSKIPPVVYPFDISIYKNICSVFGDNPLLWLWPQSPKSNGIDFVLCHDADPAVVFYWPPRDPDDLRPSIFSLQYKRQQEKKYRQSTNEEAEESVSDDYYDSGSFASDSDYSDEEYASNRQNHQLEENLYNLSGLSPQDAYQRRGWESEPEDDDSVPLVNLIPRKPSKESKDD